MTGQYPTGFLATKPEDRLPHPLFLTPTSEEVRNERRQCQDEGTDISSVEDEFDRLEVADTITRDELNELLDATRSLPVRAEYPYQEPSDLPSIREGRPSGPREIGDPGDIDDLADVVHGAWIGAIAGCWVGKPIQGWTRDQIKGFLEESDQDIADGYLSSDVSDEIEEKYAMWTTVESSTPAESMYVNDVPYMPVDDDVDYIAAGLGIAQTHGPDFEPADVANYWLQNIPAFNTYTAERVAYRNFLNLVTPPESGRFRNPYREHVGAMIRADMWGYLAFGDPEQAAEYAWRDACISHTKNGIYGEMWAAAAIAAAPFVDHPAETIEIGLSEIPANARLADALTDVLAAYETDVAYEAVVDTIHEEWNESTQFDWVHTIPSAQIVALGLLYGDGDVGDSFDYAMRAGFDTDSHGCTLGSILGAYHGANAFPDEWVKPQNDTVETSLVEYQRQQITDLRDETLSAIERFQTN